MAAILSILFPLLLIGPLRLVSAIPDVIATQIGKGSCTGFPNYYYEPGKDFTQPFWLHPDQADNSSINGLYTSINGKNVVIAVNTMLAKILYSCTNATLHEWTSGNLVYFSPSGAGEVLEYSSQGIATETYTHKINGVQQNGVFLGYGNITTWAFKFLPGPGGAGSEDFYGMRLLGALNETLDEDEFKGFIKLEAA